MPTATQCIEPELFIEHNDVTIFHTYADDDHLDVNVFWYCASLDGLFGEEFDVRTLSTWTSHSPNIPAAIIAAIDSDEIRNLIIVPPEDRDLR